MLDYSLLNQKPNISLYRDNEYVTFKDLTAKTYNGEFNGHGIAVIVEKDYIARPDLISLAIYGEDRYADLICKVNGISNPFELNEGMLIYCPTTDQINRLFTGTNSENDVLSEFKYKNKKSKNKGINDNLFNIINKTTDTIEKKKTSFQKLKNERRTPGEQTITDNNYYIDKTLGLVIY